MLFKRWKIKKLTKKIKSMQQYRQHNQPTDEILAKERAYYHQLADCYRQLRGHKSYPFAVEMEQACWRASATIDDKEAQYWLGKRLVDEGKFREQLEAEGVFASPSNDRQRYQNYEEAHAYLLASEKLGHIEAKRLRGLCYINGWGVEINRDKGFDLVVESIEQENSWDKVPQIFTALGLNKPEFFSALMKHRNKS